MSWRYLLHESTGLKYCTDVGRRSSPRAAYAPMQGNGFTCASLEPERAGITRFADEVFGWEARIRADEQARARYVRNDPFG